MNIKINKTNIIIAFAKKIDEKNIREFISRYWKKNHILARDKKFFLYEMCRNKAPSYVIAKKKDKIIGILGFICSNEDIEKSDLLLSLLKVNKTGNKLIGLRLLDFLINSKNKGIHCIGLNDKVLTLYKYLGFKIGKMDHFYWLNPEEDLNKIFVNSKKYNHTKQVTLSTFKDLKKVSSEKDILKITRKIFNEDINCKSPEIFVYRYLKHPYYSYDIYKSNSFNGLGVVRKVNINGYFGYKIVDWYGKLNDFKIFSKKLISFAKENKVSYIDLYSVGINKKNLKNSGLREVSNNVIIPNHLSPLVLKNISINYVTNNFKRAVLFRGDGDQDRPT